MRRVCFRLQVRPDMREEYARRHARIWPEMLRALADTGWSNYSLFLGEDGLLIGYFETEDLDQALAGMAERDINARWQAQMAPFFEQLDGRRPDEGLVVLEEVFNLESQLEGRAQQ